MLLMFSDAAMSCLNNNCYDRRLSWCIKRKGMNPFLFILVLLIIAKTVFMPVSLRVAPSNTPHQTVVFVYGTFQIIC